MAHDDEPTEPFDPVPGEARVGSRESLEGRADEPTRPLGADPTRPLGEGTADASTDATTGREPARGLRRFAPYLVGAAIALGVGIALLVDAVDDDPVTTGAPPDGVVTVPTTVRVAAPPTARTAPPVPTTTPRGVAPGGEGTARTTLAALLARLRADPDAFGERGDDLLAWLERLADAGGLRPAERAALLADLREWVRDGELDARLAAEASEVVLAAPVDRSGPGRGPDDDGPGRGPDDRERERDDEDDD